jgi:hypothetical protein
MIAHLDYQITYLLARLRDDLRADSLLALWLGASPDEIVRGTYRVQPIYEDKGEIFVDATQLPCIAAVILTSDPFQGIVAGSQKETVQLWYAFETPIDDMAPGGIAISGPEKAEVWKRCVWERVCYWLRNDDTFTDAGKMDSIEIGRASFFPAGHTFGGFKSELTIVRTLAPMSVADLKELHTISLDIGEGAHKTTPDGPIVEAEITVHA